MRGMRILGDYILEIVVITLITAASIASVILFIPCMVGLNNYFKNKKDVRLFRDIFTPIKEDYKVIIPFTIFELLITVFPILNIYFFNTNPEKINVIILGVSYVALFVGAIYFVTGPTIISNMNVTFFQLLRNGFMLLFGSLVRSVAALLIVAGVVALILLYPYALPATLYLVPLLVTKLMMENFYTLKARVLHTNVYNIKKQNETDGYDYTIQTRPVIHAGETEDYNENK